VLQRAFQFLDMLDKHIHHASNVHAKKHRMQQTPCSGKTKLEFNFCFFDEQVFFVVILTQQACCV